MAKSKFYAVQAGREPGVYTTWADCQAQVNQFAGAKFKAFATRAEAENAVQNGWDTQTAPPAEKTAPVAVAGDVPAYIEDSLSVDAACSGNPGAMEYKCVRTDTGEVVFASPLYPVGTNNIGEFLGLVDTLKHLKETGQSIPVYTDSVSAIAWVRNKQVKTTLVRNDSTEELWQKIDEALQWLRRQVETNTVLKWQTEIWGESKADFGRK